MDWRCPGCGMTFKRENQAHRCYSGGSPEFAFPGHRAKWLPLYMQLLRAAEAKMRFDCSYPPSGGVLWRKRSSFASVFPEAKGLRINFLSGYPMDGVEGVKSFPQSANRVINVVILGGEDRLPEIVDCITAAYMLTNQEGK